MSPGNVESADQLCSTMDTPIDPVTREPVVPVDAIPVEEAAPAPETPKPQLRILVAQQTADVAPEAVAPRAIVVKSDARPIPALEIYYTGTKEEGLAVATALSKLKGVVCRTGVVGWEV
jgi:hypothetical protein